MTQVMVAKRTYVRTKNVRIVVSSPLRERVGQLVIRGDVRELELVGNRYMGNVYYNRAYYRCIQVDKGWILLHEIGRIDKENEFFGKRETHAKTS